ncbi:MAG: DUF1929 domain-containing protein [Sandaracinaceae bacterium]
MRSQLAMYALGAVLVGCGGTLPIGDAGESMDSGPAAADSGARDAAGDSGSPGPDAGVGTGSIEGIVRDPGGAPIPDARLTLVTAAGFVDEDRTDSAGAYRFSGLGDGPYVVGASALRREFVEQSVDVDGPEVVDFVLGAETHRGRWSVVGSTEPERPAGTPSGTLMPDGRVSFCRDTQDAVIVDPSSGTTTMASASPSSQGCHMSTVLSDGRLIFVGGQAREEPAAFTEAVRTVKLYDPASNTWEVLPDLNEERWYPSLVRLGDERLLACGGGQRPDARRTATCELFDPATQRWTRTGSLAQPTEYSPSVLLLNGDVLTTWSPPQLYDVSAGTWRATGDFVQTDRGFPDHSDHSLVLLEDGTALAVGYEGSAGTAMTERYDPASGTWSLRDSPDVIRSQAEVVLLPDGRVLAAGGTLEQGSAPTNPFGEVATTDLYDPTTDAWRNLEPMAMPREYHALTLLVPDGRVITTSGTGDQACCPAPEASIEALEPPYLFRGPRPVIDSISGTDLGRGGTLTLGFSQTRAPTSVVLIGTAAVTHWMDGGVPRLVRLTPEVSGSQATITLPSTSVELPAGYYIAFLMVDDIPSEGRVVRVRP